MQYPYLIRSNGLPSNLNWQNEPRLMLKDCSLCDSYQEANGEFEIKIIMPINGTHAEKIKPWSVIFAPIKVTEGVKMAQWQCFVVYKINKSMASKDMVINAFHISYMTKYLVPFPVRKTTVTKFSTDDESDDAGLNLHFYYPEGITDIVDRLRPRTARQWLAGKEGSLLDVRGKGVYRFNNEYFYLEDEASIDNGFTVRYGKNMTGLNIDVDTTNVFTACVPYWIKELDCVEDNEPIVAPDVGRGASEPMTAAVPNENGKYWKYVFAGKDEASVVNSAHVGDYAFKLVAPLDLTSKFENPPTPERLIAEAQKYMNENKTWEPKVTLDTSFENLSRFSEYKDFKQNEDVGLNEIVRIIHEGMGVDVQAKVVAITYDCLRGVVKDVVLGNKKARIYNVMTEVQ